MDGARQLPAPLAFMEEEDAILDEAPPTSVAVLPLSPTSPVTPDPHLSCVPQDSRDPGRDFRQAEQSAVWEGSQETAEETKTGQCPNYSCDNVTLTQTCDLETNPPIQKDQGFHQDIVQEQECPANLTKSDDGPLLFSIDFSSPACSDQTAGHRHLQPHLGQAVRADSGQSRDTQTDSRDLNCKKPCRLYSQKNDDKPEQLTEVSQHGDVALTVEPAGVQKLRNEMSADSGVHKVKAETSTDAECDIHKRGNKADVSFTAVRDDDIREDRMFQQRTQPSPDEADRHTQRQAASRGPPNGEEEEKKPLRPRLELRLSNRRKSQVFSKTRLKAFLLKYTLFLLTFCFWTASVGAMALGGWVLRERGQLVRDSASFFLDPSGMLCLLGALTFLVAFCGCLGALRENIILLKVFQVSMVVVVCVEMLLALLVFAFYQMPQVRKHLQGGPEQVLTVAIRRYHDDHELRRWIDWIQRECCGARHSEKGYQDWQENPYFNCTPHNPSAQRCGVPRSCCIIERGEYINHMCGFDTTNKQRGELFGRIYTQGCMRGLGLWLSAHDVAIGAVSVAIILPEILCVVLAHQLVHHIRHQRARWTQLHTRHT